MKKLITKGILIGAGLEFLVKFAIFLSSEISRKPKFDEPRMDCLGGLQYVIFIIIAILAVLISLPAYLNLYPKVRNSKWLSFLTFFALHLVYFVLCLPLIWEKYSSYLDFLALTPCVFWIVWVITYWRIRKISN
ncbi:hypothetical protein [Epilithonimonas zeae]|uniref:hypothetical protein n=1 Tax=Epilithonimonas zeae TaxID=1416779 RepID=UPI00200BAD23|nr:hypothetical protein [Epilithonimonas zeae]UQB69045.1 hypothetical protein KI430_00945 [Epilithonimonas zeae]